MGRSVEADGVIDFGAESLPVASNLAPTHFVYFRCWPGFADGFPYSLFNGLPDDEAERAIRHAVAARLWSRRAKIIQARKIHRLKSIAALKKQAKSRLGGTHSAKRRMAESKITRRLRRVYWGNGRQGRFVGLAQAVGWHTGRGAPIHVNDRSYVFSPRVWLAGVADLELAEAIVSDLTRLTPRSDSEAKQRHVLNPHFGFAPAAAMPRGERAAIIADIGRLNEGAVESAWYDVAKTFLSVAGSIVAAWCGAEIRQQQIPVNPPIEPSVSEAPPKGKLSAKQKAYLSFKYAEYKNGESLKDKDAFLWLEENGIDLEDEKDPGEFGCLTDYKLPPRGTWLTYVIKGRSAAGEKKNDSRVGRTGRSITKYDQL